MSQGTDIDSIKSFNEKPVKNAKFITAAYNIVGIIGGLIALFYNLYNKTNNAVALLMYPLLGIAIILLSKGTIKLSSNDKPRIFTSIYLGILFPVMFMAFIAYDDYTFLQMNHFWLPFALIIVIVAAAFYKVSIDSLEGKSKGDIVFVILIALIYGYGGTCQINCAFDYSDTQVYNTTVLNKHAHHGRHDYYYLTLAPWGPEQQIKEVEDDGALYDQVKIGDTVKVNLKKGLLNIPWFIITKN